MFLAHIIALIFSGLCIMIADHDAYLWFRGKKEILESRKMELLHGLTWLGLLVLIITGFFLFYPAREYLLSRPIFILKMVYVTLLVGNGFVIGKLSHTAHTKSFASLSKGERVMLFVSGLISTISWIGATITAFFIFD